MGRSDHEPVAQPVVRDGRCADRDPPELCQQPELRDEHDRLDTRGWRGHHPLHHGSHFRGGIGAAHGAGGDVYVSATAVPGDYWTFSLDYRSDGTLTGSPYIQISGIGGTQTPYVRVLPLVQTTPGRFSVTTTAPLAAGATIIAAAVFAPTTGALIIDNVLLEKCPPPCRTSTALARSRCAGTWR